MALSAGIVGLPNVGKSSLFSTITKMSILIDNYPFSTIEPNVGIVNLMDPRIDALAKLVQPEKVTYATFKFVDIAGLVKGASEGEGLGNKFLQNIRDVDAICHVVRCFDDPGVVTTTNLVDPITDAQIIDLELIYSDLAVVNNAIKRLPKKIEGCKSSKIDVHDLLGKIKTFLESEKPLRLMEWNQHEINFLSSYNFLTRKPMLYIGNVNDEDITKPILNLHFQKLAEYAKSKQSPALALAIKLEKELAEFTPIEAQEMMQTLGINESGLQMVIKEAFQLLNLSTYFTVGKKEIRAWPFRNGLKAPECAGIIHSDFARCFIRVEVIKYDDFITYKSDQEVKKHGRLMIEGKNYQVQDGDICLFRSNA